MGAPLLMEALPESRMILLVRDPRDVAASTLDAAKEGGWLHSWVDENKVGWRKDSTPEQVRTIERITAPLLNEYYPQGT